MPIPRLLAALVATVGCLGTPATAGPVAPATADDGAPSWRIAVAPGGTQVAVPGTDRVIDPLGLASVLRIRGAVEVLADPSGIVAYRVGEVTGEGSGAVVGSWRLPAADAVALAGSWWTLVRAAPAAEPRRPDPVLLATLGVEVVDAVVGDADADGADDAVVVFRRPYRATVVNSLLPDPARVDALGRTLHLGVYAAADLRQRWVAGTVFRPVSAVAACDGALALAFSSAVDAADTVALGAVRWGGFGFVGSPNLPDLPGGGAPACADVDGDGRTEPLAIERTLP